MALNIREVQAEETNDPGLYALSEEIRDYYRQSGTLIEINLDVVRGAWGPLIAAGAAVCIVLEEDGEAVGMVSGFYFVDPLSGRPVANEVFWFVAARARHLGYGGLLIQAFEAWAKNRGATRIRIAHLVDLRADENRRLYEGLGFKACEVVYEKEV